LNELEKMFQKQHRKRGSLKVFLVWCGAVFKLEIAWWTKGSAFFLYGAITLSVSFVGVSSICFAVWDMKMPPDKKEKLFQQLRAKEGRRGTKEVNSLCFKPNQNEPVSA